MSYRITIVRVEEVPTVKREWVKVADTGGKDGGAEYDYATYESTETKERPVYSQTVETLDMAAVITAVNKHSSEPAEAKASS